MLYPTELRGRLVLHRTVVGERTARKAGWLQTNSSPYHGSMRAGLYFVGCGPHGKSFETIS